MSRFFCQAVFLNHHANVFPKSLNPTNRDHYIHILNCSRCLHTSNILKEDLQYAIKSPNICLMSYMLDQALNNYNLHHGLKLGWYRAFNAATLAKRFVAVFLYLVVQTPRCGGSWGLFYNTGLLRQPALKISMKWTSQLEFVMKDQSVCLQDIHDNQYQKLFWQIS